MHFRLITVGAIMVAASGAGTFAARSWAGSNQHGEIAAPGPVDRIVIDPHAITRVIPSDFFGINFVGFWDDAAGSQASAKALRQTPIRTVRFPGGAPANWYDWQDPYYKGWSHTSPLKVWRYVRSLGGKSVMFATNYSGHVPNPPGKSYAVNSPENAAAWVRYNKHLGIRATMEVGNEEDMNLLHKTDDPAYGAYIANFIAQARAMHKADPHVRVLGPVGTNEYFWWGIDGLGMFLQQAGNRTGIGQVDGVSLHFYKGNGWLEARSVAQYWTAPNGPWTAIQKMIQDHDTRKLPVYITEWNVGGADQHSTFNPTLGHALANADMIGALARSGVTEEDYFDTHGGQSWGLLYGKGESHRLDSPTPTYYAMALWRHMGTHMLSLHQGDDAATVSSSYATSGRNGSVQVLVINKQGLPRKISVALQGASPAEHRLRVYSLRGTSGSIDDQNALYDGRRMPSPQHSLPGPQDAGIIHGQTVSYVVPGYSAVVLDLSGTTRNANMHWNNPTTTASAPTPRFSVHGKVEHASLGTGQTQTMEATIKSNQDTGSILADIEVYDDTNAKVYQYSRTLEVRANQPVTVTARYTLPDTARPGQYHCKIGVFGPNWNPLYLWIDNASTFEVTRR